jgi:tetratricopeptide (TPR) repeat protein
MILRAIRLIAVAVALLPGVYGSPPVLAQSDELQEANQLFKQGQLDRALERINAHLAKNPKDARGRFLRGIIFTEQNKPNDAIKVFTELTQEFPELPEPYNNLAVLYASQGQYDKARNALEMAIRTHPSYATAHENLGDIYAKMASQAYDKALQLDKSNTTAQTKLNLIKDLFPAGKPRPSAKGEPPTKVAAAPAVTKPAPPAAAPPAPPATKSAEPAPKESPREPAAKSAPPKEPPAAKAEPAGKETAKPAAAQNPDEVVKSLKGWAKAWSTNDVDGYLAHYAPDFRTPKGEKRSDWEAQRKARIAKPRKIDVDIEAPKVTFSDTKRVTVTFRQRYESGGLKVSSTKTVVMVKAGEKWLIQEERVGS